jgi:signal transduction histidine kinase
MANAVNRELLAEWLSPAVEIWGATDVEREPADVDLCIVDDEAFERSRPVLRAMKDAVPTFVPVLLVVRQPPPSITGRPPQRTDSIVWEYVDDVIQTPISKAEFEGRLQVLFRARWQSVALEETASQLAFVDSLLRHEIRNAMAVILPRAIDLQERLMGDEEQSAATIVSWSEEVTDLVDRLSTLVKTLIETNDEDALVVTDVAAVVDELAVRFTDTYPDVQFTFQTAPASIAADELLAEVLGNLIHNAVEHNDAEQPEVSVRVTTDADFVTVTVSDNGPGIPNERKGAIFRRRVRDRGPETAIHGFGLFFVDRKVRHYGGTIEVRDNVPRGTTMCVRLPHTRE